MKLLVFLAAVLVVQAAKKKVDYTGYICINIYIINYKIYNMHKI